MAGVGLDQLSRIIGNLYSHAFEKSQTRQNAIYNELMDVGQNDTPAVGGMSDSTLKAEILHDRPIQYYDGTAKTTTPSLAIGWNYGGTYDHWNGVVLDSYGTATLRTTGGTPVAAGYAYAGMNRECAASNFPAAPPSSFYGASLLSGDSNGGSFYCSTVPVHNAASDDTYPFIKFMWPLPNPGSASFSLECIFQIASADASARIVWLLGNLGSSSALSMRLNAGLLEFSSPSDAVIATKGSTRLDDGNVHHVVVTRNAGNQLAWYADGVQLGTQTITNITAQSFQTMGAGANVYNGSGGVYYLIGKIAHMAVYDYALTAARVAAHAAAVTGYANPQKVARVRTFIPPKPRYYQDLTTAGSDQSIEPSAYGFATGVTVQYPPGVANATQMWGVIRLRPTWAFGSPPTTPTIFRWATDANNRLILSFSGGNWTFSRLNGGAGASASVAGSHLANADITLGFYCTSTTVAVSLNGANFVTAGNTNIPTTPTPNIDIGNGDNPSNSAIHWMMLGVGTISNADIAAFDAFGNYDPEWYDVAAIASIPTLDPSFLWWGRDNTHTPAGRWGESVWQP